MADTPEFQVELRFPSDSAESQRVQHRLVEELARHRFSEKVIFGIKLAIEEALVNAIKHGNQLDPDKQVRFAYSVDDQRLTIEIEDQGPGFTPEDVPDPTAPENLERPCGRGLLLMRAYMTDCQFLPPGNVCRMTRVRE